MGENDIGVRDAGRLIAESGLVDDVRRGRTNRERAQDGGTDDADDRRPVRQDRDDRRQRRDDRDEDDRPRSRRREVDDEEYGDDRPNYDEDERQDDDDEDDADASNRDDGEDGEDDREDDDDTDDGDSRNERGERLHKVKVAGQTLTVTESELIAGYSRTKDYHQKTQALAQRGRELNTAHTSIAQQYTKRLQAVNAVMSGVRNMLAGEINGEEMRALRAKDPQQWAIAREDYNARLQQVDAVLNHLTEAHERHRSEYDSSQSQTANATAQQETERLMEFIPDWREGRNGKPSGAVRLATYLRKSGFADQEFMPIIDHRMLTIADKARRYDELVARRSAEPQRKAKPVPKRMQPGKSNVASRSQQEGRQDRSEYRRAKDRAAKTGDMRDAGDAINALFQRDAKKSRRNRFR
jgi:hypothetical protein